MFNVGIALISVATALAFGACGAAWAPFTGTAATTNYWDCCKPSCSWAQNSGPNVTAPVKSCAKDGVTAVGKNVETGCSGGSAYACNDNAPFLDRSNANIAYAFVAAVLEGRPESELCCTCLQLKFHHKELASKTLIVQITNTGRYQETNHIDIQVPGGGVGDFPQGCATQWNAPTNGWGKRYGGVSNASGCSALPTVLRAGCGFRFGWMRGVVNPEVTFERVKCPSILTHLSQCSRRDD